MLEEDIKTSAELATYIEEGLNEYIFAGNHAMRDRIASFIVTVAEHPEPEIIERALSVDLLGQYLFTWPIEVVREDVRGKHTITKSGWVLEGVKRFEFLNAAIEEACKRWIQQRMSVWRESKYGEEYMRTQKRIARSTEIG